MNEHFNPTAPADDLGAASTRERLLVAAGEVFAEQGYSNATIRDICSRAGANIAAVNYHFQGKDGLYAAVMEYAHNCALQTRHTLDSDAPPQAQLRAFIETMMRRLLDQGRPAWQAKLMSREMIDPTPALDRLVSIAIRPQVEALSQIVRAMLGEAAEPVVVRRVAGSILGQCLLHRHCRPVLDRLYPDVPYTQEEIQSLADHITAFSLAAIAGICAGSARCADTENGHGRRVN